MRPILLCLMALLVACGEAQTSEEASKDHILSEQEEALKKAKEAARELEHAGQKTKKIIDEASNR